MRQNSVTQRSHCHRHVTTCQQFLHLSCYVQSRTQPCVNKKFLVKHIDTRLAEHSVCWVTARFVRLRRADIAPQGVLRYQCSTRRNPRQAHRRIAFSQLEIYQIDNSLRIRIVEYRKKKNFEEWQSIDALLRLQDQKKVSGLGTTRSRHQRNEPVWNLRALIDDSSCPLIKFQTPVSGENPEKVNSASFKDE